MRAAAVLPWLMPRPAHVQREAARDAAVAAARSIDCASWAAACVVVAAVVGGVGLHVS